MFFISRNKKYSLWFGGALTVKNNDDYESFKDDLGERYR